MKAISDLIGTLTWDELCAERNAIGLCMWFNCNEPLHEDWRCLQHFEENNLIVKIGEEHPDWTTAQVLKEFDRQMGFRWDKNVANK